MNTLKPIRSKYNNGKHLRLTDSNHESMNRIVQMLEVSPSAIVNYVLGLTLRQLESLLTESMNPALKECFRDALQKHLDYKPNERKER